MKIDKEKIEYLAKLSRLSFGDLEFDNMVCDIQEILKFVDKLDDINTDNVESLTHIHNESNVYRKDVVNNLNIKNSILENAPKHNSDYIKVPKVIGKKTKS